MDLGRIGFGRDGVSAPPATESRATAPDWTRAPERSNAFALRVMTTVALWFGRPVARGVLHLITLYFMFFAPTARRHAQRFLARALGRPPRWRDRYRQIHAFASTLLDRVYLLRGRTGSFDVSVHGGPLIHQTLDEGRGAFLLGAHVGSFEVLRAVGEVRANLRVAMVMYPDNARKINEALRAIAPEYQPRIIALGRMDSMLAVRDWLDGGGLAGMLGDRSLPTESQRGTDVRVSFLGHEAVFADGPFRLAALLRRKVIFMAGLYLGGARYDVRFEPLADFSERVDATERERRIRDAVVAYAQRLEALAREQPYNWFNFHDFWGEETRG